MQMMLPHLVEFHQLRSLSLGYTSRKSAEINEFSRMGDLLKSLYQLQLTRLDFEIAG